MTRRTTNLLLATATAGLSLFALLFANPPEGDAFAGSDGQAIDVIDGLRPGYTPWASPLWEPPSGEIESLLFGLQSALGSAVLFYALGYWRGRRGARVAPRERDA
jgi:cobalt/nickel transport protein